MLDKYNIKCFYADKRLINSNQYYDFGLYGVDDTTILYNPIYKKGIFKELEGQQVYIGDTKIQRQKIDEFEQDFDRVWRLCEDNHRRQKNSIDGANKNNKFKRHYYGTNSSPYYKTSSLSLGEFDKGYYKKLSLLFKEKLQYDPLKQQQ